MVILEPGDPGPIGTEPLMRKRPRLTVGDLKRTSERAERLQQLLLDVLAGPYVGQPAHAMAITAACVETGHPPVRQSGQCACGERQT